MHTPTLYSPVIIACVVGIVAFTTALWYQKKSRQYKQQDKGMLYLISIYCISYIFISLKHYHNNSKLIMLVFDISSALNIYYNCNTLHSGSD